MSPVYAIEPRSRASPNLDHTVAQPTEITIRLFHAYYMHEYGTPTVQTQTVPLIATSALRGDCGPLHCFMKPYAEEQSWVYIGTYCQPDEFCGLDADKHDFVI